GGQPRVRVQGDDILDTLGHPRRAPVEAEESRVASAAQQAVEFVQLAALALPADPQLLAFVPDPSAMEQQEPVAAGRRRVPAVQAGNGFDSDLQQRVVAFGRLACRIRPVREQSELNVPADTCEMMDFQSLDLLGDGFGPGQKSGHHYQSAQVSRYFAAQLKPRDLRGAEPACYPLVDQRNRRIDRRHCAEQPEHAEQYPVQTGLNMEEDRESEQEQGHEGAGAGIAADSESAIGAARDRRKGRVKAQGSLEGGTALGGQMIARVLAASLGR